MQKIVLAMLVVLLFLLAYAANLRAKYADIFGTYGVYRSETCPGPWKIALAAERPWVQAFLMARPTTPAEAHFALYLMRDKGADINAMCAGFLQTGQDLTATLEALTRQPGGPKDASRWQDPANPLWAAYRVPYDAPVVNLYRGTEPGPGGTHVVSRLPLEVLYGAGFLSLASLVSAGSATSLESLWAMCFSEQIPAAAKKPPPPPSQCSTAGSHALSGAFGGAGIGAMIGAAGGPLGVLVGSLIGGLFGGAASAAANNGACCLVGSCPG